MGNKHKHVISNTYKTNADKQLEVDRMRVMVKDSSLTRERQHGDTIYRERIVFRDRIEYRDRWRERLVQDTIVVTDSVVQIIEHPPTRYVPTFYKWCTRLFWLIVAGVGVYIAWRCKNV